MMNYEHEQCFNITTYIATYTMTYRAGCFFRAKGLLDIIPTKAIIQSSIIWANYNISPT